MIYSFLGGKMYYVYIIRCQDNSLYTGITTHIERRMKEHFCKLPQSAKYTKTHSALQLECVWTCKNRSLASRLEYRLKRLRKENKEEIIKNHDLNILSLYIDIEEYQYMDVSNCCNF